MRSNCSRLLFATVPKAKIEVQRVPVFKETTAPGEPITTAASMDGTRPGIFYANLRDMNEIPKWSMPTLAYHEGVPEAITGRSQDGPEIEKGLPQTPEADSILDGLLRKRWALPYSEWRWPKKRAGMKAIPSVTIAGAA